MPVRPRTILVTLVGAHAVNDLYSTVLPAFLPALAEEFELDYTELGILSFAFTILGGVLQPVLGNVADRSGRRRWMLVFGFAVVGIYALAASLQGCMEKLLSPPFRVLALACGVACLWPFSLEINVLGLIATVVLLIYNRRGLNPTVAVNHG